MGSWIRVGATEAAGLAALSSESGPELDRTAAVTPPKQGSEGVVSRATRRTPTGLGSMVFGVPLWPLCSDQG